MNYKRVMNKSEIIKKISDKAGVPEEQQKSFFEIFLVKIADEQDNNIPVVIPEIGSFEFHKSFNDSESDSILFKSHDTDDLYFDVPERENYISTESVDSYFSISIGKPVIPLKNGDEDELFIPQSDEEVLRMLELKAEKFISDSVKTEADSNENIDLEDISFSFLNWKKTSDLTERITKIEEEFDESTKEEETIPENVDNEDEEELLIAEKFIPDNEPDEELIEESFIRETEEDDDKSVNVENEFNDSAEDWVDEIIEETNIEEEKIPEEVHNELEPSIPEHKQEKEEDLGIKEAFKYAEERKARLQKRRKRSYAGFIFAAVIILATAAFIYFSYYFPGKETNISLQNIEPVKFNTVIEREYDTPVSYPYSAGMFGSYYKSIDENLLKPVVPEISENEIDEIESVKEPEIRNPLPAARIKGYIYKYEDGTYAVQVSSWKSKSIAISETQKYLDAGYKAYIEQTALAEKTYYRVRIGGFNSLADAEKFAE